MHVHSLEVVQEGGGEGHIFTNAQWVKHARTTTHTHLQTDRQTEKDGQTDKQRQKDRQRQTKNWEGKIRSYNERTAENKESYMNTTKSRNAYGNFHMLNAKKYQAGYRNPTKGSSSNTWMMNGTTEWTNACRTMKERTNKWGKHNMYASGLHIL